MPVPVPQGVSMPEWGFRPRCLSHGPSLYPPHQTRYRGKYISITRKTMYHYKQRCIFLCMCVHMQTYTYAFNNCVEEKINLNAIPESSFFTQHLKIQEFRLFFSYGHPINRYGLTGCDCVCLYPGRK